MSRRLHRIRSVRGKRVALTGWFFESQAEVAKELRKRGAEVRYRARVRVDTDILFKGISGAWKFGEHGLKENQLAQNIMAGHPAVLIYAEELERWLSHGSPMTPADTVAGESVADLEAEHLAVLADYDWNALAGLRVLEKVKATDMVTTTKARREQGLIRSMLFGGRDQGACDLCGERLPRQLLVVAHIKPRRYCTSRERNDIPTVVMLACQLGCDALYERGWITVDERGKLEVSRIATGRFGAALRKRYRERRFPRYGPDRDEYFEWHRQYRFQ